MSQTRNTTGGKKFDRKKDFNSESESDEEVPQPVVNKSNKGKFSKPSVKTSANTSAKNRGETKDSDEEQKEVKYVKRNNNNNTVKKQYNNSANKGNNSFNDSDEEVKDVKKNTNAPKNNSFKPDARKTSAKFNPNKKWADYSDEEASKKKAYKPRTNYSKKEKNTEEKPNGNYTRRARSPEKKSNNTRSVSVGKSKSKVRKFIKKDKMTFERVKEIVDSYFTDGYKGLELKNSEIPPSVEVSELLNRKTVFDKAQIPTLNDDEFDMGEFNNTYKGLSGFLKGINFRTGIENLKNATFYRIDDTINEEMIKIIQKVIPQNLPNVLQIGFNSGMLAISLLKNNESMVVSIDKMLHDYSVYSNLFINSFYGSRNCLLAGDSSDQLATLSKISNVKYDLIVINDDIRYEKYYNNIESSLPFAKKECIFLLNNISPHNNFGFGPYLAMVRVLREKKLFFVSHHKTSEYENGFAILTTNKSNGVELDYKGIEEKLPMFYLTRLLRDTLKDRDIEDEEKDEVKAYIRKLSEDKLIKMDKYLKDNTKNS